MARPKGSFSYEQRFKWLLRGRNMEKLPYRSGRLWFVDGSWKRIRPEKVVDAVMWEEGA